MGGSPRRHARVVRTVQALDPTAEDYTGDETRAYWIDAVLARVAGGYPVKERAADGTETEGFGEPQFLWEACRDYGFNFQTVKEVFLGDERLLARLQAAEASHGDILAAQTVRIADASGVTKGETAKAKMQSENRRWLASRMDRSKWGERSGVDLTVKDSRVLDREQMLLEAARGVAYMLQAASDVADARDARADSNNEKLLLPAPNDTQ